MSFINFSKLFADVPGPISSKPTVIDTGRNWISLTWGKAENRSAAPVVAYKVECWMKGGEARWTELGMSPLNTFDAFNLQPEGEYQFRITPRNRYGWGEPIQTDTIVIGKHNELPEFTKLLPGKTKVLVGSTLTLECEYKGCPLPTITWYKDKTEIHPEEDERYQILCKSGKCTLEVVDLKDTDTGRIMCEASNSIGRVTTFTRLFVVSDPKVLEAYEHLSW